MNKAIIAQTSSPRGVAGNCPSCATTLYNPSMDQHRGLSMTLRWEIRCSGCGAKVLVENPRFGRSSHGHKTRGR